MSWQFLNLSTDTKLTQKIPIGKQLTNLGTLSGVRIGQLKIGEAAFFQVEKSLWSKTWVREWDNVAPDNWITWYVISARSIGAHYSNHNRQIVLLTGPYLICRNCRICQDVHVGLFFNLTSSRVRKLPDQLPTDQKALGRRYEKTLNSITIALYRFAEPLRRIA